MKMCRMIVVIILAFFFSSINAQVITEDTTTGPLKIKCKVNQQVDTKLRPLLVFLHGIGEVGSNLEYVLRYGPLDQIRDGVDIGAAKDWIIVHPQNPSSTWSIAEIDEVIEYFSSNYPVDKDQIFLMGASLGGLGVWTYAQSPAHVSKIAAIVPICGGGNDPSKASVLVNEGIPGWAGHAKSDTTVPYTTTKRMVDAVNNLSGKSQLLLSSYGMSGHGAWNYFLRPEYGVYEWLKYQRLSHRQKRDPTEITLKPGSTIIIKSE